MIRIFQFVTPAFALLLLAGCASQPNVVSSADPNVDLGQYRTYDFAAVVSTDGQPYQSLESGYLKSAASRELEARGFTRSEDPDLLVNFSIEMQEKVRSRSVPTAGGGLAYDPFYDDVYYGGWGTSHTTRIDQYTEGTLNIDLIDKRGAKVVWQGATRGRLTKKDYENPQATLDGAVAEIFSQFPPR